MSKLYEHILLKIDGENLHKNNVQLLTIEKTYENNEVPLCI